MRHEAAGITTRGVPEDDPPRRRRLRGDLPARARQPARRRHRDACRSTPSTRRARSAASGWCPGMLKDKVVALAKTLPQRPRSRLVPLPEYADAFIAETAFGDGSLLDALAAHARRANRPRPSRRADFKHEQLRAAPADEPARRRRARPPARRVAPPRRAEGELGGAGALGVPGARGVAPAGAGGRRRRRRDAAPARRSARATGARRVADARDRRPRAGRRAAAPADRRAPPTPPGPSASCPS